MVYYIILKLTLEFLLAHHFFHLFQDPFSLLKVYNVRLSEWKLIISLSWACLEVLMLAAAETLLRLNLTCIFNSILIIEIFILRYNE